MKKETTNIKRKMVNAKRGITLVALVITVIVLLILAGTAISIAINGGDIFTKAKTATEAWNTAVQNEEDSLVSFIDTYLLYDEDTEILRTYFTGHNALWMFQNGYGREVESKLLYSLGPDMANESRADKGYYYLYNNKVFWAEWDNTGVFSNIKKENIDPNSLGIKEQNGETVLVTVSRTFYPSEYSSSYGGTYVIEIEGQNTYNALFEENGIWSGILD